MQSRQVTDMARRNELAITVGDIKAALRHLPDAMPVEFSPITSAFLGTMNPMRFGNELNFYNDTGDEARAYDPGAHCSIYLFEEPSDD
jgi:hypothetical protein